ncbi:anthranilate phosphoribosyltransferase [Riemerella anatipestifer]|uniref:Anthranilate phosphoribosyltransferase n=1 Tax=Riemerella anatipestifer TaxID=34085 RepID=A0AAP3APG4_RIEAN|nr:anthranilate phosphoribosyltransferase [Riemerella anatipestifer]AZZ57633.1 anthranilate phosphoribosyltransferase [Riemerella anatipestifer]MBT0571927.1 anthranilate phosphoribosyltransferase [Riemerella anatipestifer]MCO7318093.1 anthranilate phosphoribosyltransferase [Riemerella anatipestifer]MCQ4154346.1 anthranilate phosphoribosyltransferase [Riemerella anatipestifer]MCQ4180307.1 anthranilate phosphoribosyltransferase [Riemerella anatipestifer]
MKQILNYLFNHQTLSKSEAKSVMIELAQNKFNETEATAFISVFMMRAITLDELMGFREALLNLATPVDLGTRDLVDIVGTGGDGKNTFNISTLASFIVAGAGQKVAKHGNYGVSSVSGSSNVLELLGYQFKNNSEGLKSDLEKGNICFLHAPLFHPALKSVAPLRKALGLRTFFNLLGPLVNPVQPKYSMIGVYNLEIARLYQYLLQKENAEFMLVHALDGYDEISLTQDTKVFDKNGEYIYSAEELGFKNISEDQIYGGETKEEAATIFLNILDGKGTPEQNAVVLANAAMALYNTKKYGDYQNCFELAKKSLLERKAKDCLNKITA